MNPHGNNGNEAMCPLSNTAMAKARGELQSSHEQETSKLEEERNILQRTLSTKRAKLVTTEKERENLQGQVQPQT